MPFVSCAHTGIAIFLVLRQTIHVERNLCPWLGRFGAMLSPGDRRALKDIDQVSPKSMHAYSHKCTAMWRAKRHCHLWPHQLATEANIQMILHGELKFTDESRLCTKQLTQGAEHCRKCTRGLGEIVVHMDSPGWAECNGMSAQRHQKKIIKKNGRKWRAEKEYVQGLMQSKKQKLMR